MNKIETASILGSSFSEPRSFARDINVLAGVALTGIILSFFLFYLMRAAAETHNWFGADAVD